MQFAPGTTYGQSGSDATGGDGTTSSRNPLRVGARGFATGNPRGANPLAVTSVYGKL
jgi:hypothetical protein